MGNKDKILSDFSFQLQELAKKCGFKCDWFQNYLTEPFIYKLTVAAKKPTFDQIVTKAMLHE